MKQGRYAKIIQQGAAVYLGMFLSFPFPCIPSHYADLTAAVLEYLVAEMVELSGNVARDSTFLPFSFILLPFHPNGNEETDNQIRNPESTPDS
jgi:hypothetical protein